MHMRESTDSRCLNVALAGIGKIARDQHVPTLMSRSDASLVATVSRNASLDGVPGFNSLDDAFARVPEIEAVVICTPPVAHYRQAREALNAGRHVFLEKPPTAVLAEMRALERQADDLGLTLFTSWHSRAAAGVEPARRWLSDKKLRSVRITWKEDVRRWHPGQDWIFEQAGMGVFDPGINALSIATHILPKPFMLDSALLIVPENRQAPIAASLRFTDEDTVQISAEFDFRVSGRETWEVHVDSEEGVLVLSEGGSRLIIDGAEQLLGTASEYTVLYDQFIGLVRESRSGVDVTPLIHVADAFLKGERQAGESFHW